jgi:pimeloyl-ACP methyl ester carboxylesterase
VPDTGTFFDALLPWLVSHRYFADPDRVEWLRALLHRNPHQQKLEGFFRQIEAIRRHDVLERLVDVRCPALVAVGEDDLIAPPRYAQAIAQRLPQARFEVLKGIGHAPPIEDSDRFNRLLDEFLRGAARAPSRPQAEHRMSGSAVPGQ